MILRVNTLKCYDLYLHPDSPGAMFAQHSGQ
jgi:hypothetical protein